MNTTCAKRRNPKYFAPAVECRPRQVAGVESTEAVQLGEAEERPSAHSGGVVFAENISDAEKTMMAERGMN